MRQGKWEGDVISTLVAYGIVRAGGWAQLRNPTQGQNGQPLVMRLVITDSGVFRGRRYDEGHIVGNNGQMFMAPVHYVQRRCSKSRQARRL